MCDAFAVNFVFNLDCRILNTPINFALSGKEACWWHIQHCFNLAPRFLCFNKRVSFLQGNIAEVDTYI
jgi:hypothetical protein